VYFDFAVLFTASSAVVVSDFFKILFVAARRRSAAFANGEWNGHVRWEAVVMMVVVMDLVALISLDISISRQRPAIIGIERRLSAYILRTRWSWWASLTRIDVNVDIDVLVHNRFPSIGSECSIGYL